jgi:hypothetical protein
MTPFSEMNEDYSYNDNDYRQGYPRQERPNVFAIFARGLGILSIFCAIFSIFYGAFIAGGLAVVLALLSRGSSERMCPAAKTGLCAGAVGIVLQVALFAFSIYSIIYIPEYRERFNAMYEQIYGESFDDSMDRIMNNMDASLPEGVDL